MTPEQHEKAKAVFLSCIAAPADDRDRILMAACDGDGALRAEVERLLRYHQPSMPGEAGPSEATVVVADAPAASPPAPKGPPPGHADEDLLATGAVIGDRYAIVAPLGRGGMGVVYRARDLKLEQDVAIKFLTPALSGQPMWVARLRQEVRIALSVTHPNVCRVYDLGEVGGSSYLTMEYIEGEDLASLQRRVGVLSRKKALQIAGEVALGLHAAHQRGIVHRDLKPANVIIDREGHAHITDFGLAILPVLGKREVRGGTPAYMAPEQLTAGPVTQAADIYALGLLIHELLTGEPAIAAESLGELLDPDRRPKPRPIDSVVADLPPGLEAVIDRCLLPDAADRPQSALLVAAELPGADVLAAALAAGETPSPDLIAAANPKRIPARRKVGLAIASMAMLAGVVWLKATSPLPWDQVGGHSPTVMSDRADQLLVGVSGGGGSHRAYGFCDASDLQLAVGDAFDGTPPLRLDLEAGPYFWLRASPAKLVPIDYANVLLGANQTTVHDPPPSPGSVLVMYDRAGDLVLYRAWPGEGLPGSSLIEPQAPGALQTLLAAASLRPDGQTPMEVSGDLSAALQMATVGKDGRGESWFISRQGRVTAFAAAKRESKDVVGALAEAIWRKRLISAMLWLVFLGIMLAGVPWAWHSYRSGHADMLGALKLALGVFLVALIVRLLRGPGGADLAEAVQRLAVGSIYAAGLGGLVAAFYLALDRHARRYWPDTLVTWTRMMALGWRDAALREHVLAGAALGIFWALLTAGERRLVSLAWPVRPIVATERIADRLVGPRSLVAGILDLVPQSVLYGLLFMLVLVVARRLAGNRTAAAAIALVVLIVLLVPRGAHPYTSWAVWGLAGAGFAIAAMTHFGVLTLVLALFVATLLNTTPMTLEPSSWHLDAMLLVLGLLVALVLLPVLPSRREKNFIGPDEPVSTG